MFGLGLAEITIVLVIITLLFGAKRFPHLGKGIGEAISGFKKALDADNATDPIENKIANERRSK